MKLYRIGSDKHEQQYAETLIADGTLVEVDESLYRIDAEPDIAAWLEETQVLVRVNGADDT